jgi:hypothetical protein
MKAMREQPSSINHDTSIAEFHLMMKPAGIRLLIPER